MERKTRRAVIPLTAGEQSTLRQAAFGAVMLVSLANQGGGRARWGNIVGAKVLTDATGIVGRLLSGNQNYDLGWSSTAEVADQVLAALSETVSTLAGKATGQAGEFRRVVMTAVRQAPSRTRRGETPVHTDMIAKIAAALGDGHPVGVSGGEVI